jgi:hypothetical protein
MFRASTDALKTGGCGDREENVTLRTRPGGIWK